MKEVTLFESFNGDLFRDKNKCIENDNKITFIENIINQLIKPPSLNEDEDFRRGKYFIQQDLELVNKLRIELLVFIRKYNDFWVIDKMIEGKEFVHPSWLLIKGLENDRLFSNAFSRFASIDLLGREWSCYTLAYPT